MKIIPQYIKQKNSIIYYLTPQHLKERENTEKKKEEYSIEGFSQDAGTYYFVQLKEKTHLKKGDLNHELPPGTIFFYAQKKNKQRIII